MAHRLTMFDSSIPHETSSSFFLSQQTQITYMISALSIALCDAHAGVMLGVQKHGYTSYYFYVVGVAFVLTLVVMLMRHSCGSRRTEPDKAALVAADADRKGEAAGGAQRTQLLSD
jgi:hypothetical protein